MQELVCPNCGKEFKIDGSGYAEILKQVRNSEFESDLRVRIELAESEKQQAIELAEVKLKSELDKIATANLNQTSACGLNLQSLKSSRPLNWPK